MVLDAAETVPSTFGFSREQFGHRRETQKFPEVLWKEREEEIRLEESTEAVIAEYRRRRDFPATGEPIGGTPGSNRDIFVVQLHHVSRRHFDLRPNGHPPHAGL